MSSALELHNLRVGFGDRTQAVRGISVAVREGEIHALVGESGAGKSVSARAILGLLPSTARIRFDRLRIGGREINAADPRVLAGLRGRKVAMVFQEPARHLNPSMTVGRLIGEALVTHLQMNRRAATTRVKELLEFVDLDAATARAYPHELSGGMKQRALIALAVSCDPELLIADEPTTALDVTVQAQILALLDRLRRRLNMGILLVTHDLALVQNAADTVSVMYAGRIVDRAPAAELFSWPVHPYTELLLESVPVADHRGRPLLAVPGRVPDATDTPPGCAFHPRCPLALDHCRASDPVLETVRPDHETACHRTAMRIGGGDV